MLSFTLKPKNEINKRIGFKAENWHSDFDKTRSIPIDRSIVGAVFTSQLNIYL